MTTQFTLLGVINLTFRPPDFFESRYFCPFSKAQKFTYNTGRGTRIGPSIVVKGGPIRVPRPVFTLHTEIETPNIWHDMICDVNGRILTYSFKNVRSTTFA